MAKPFVHQAVGQGALQRLLAVARRPGDIDEGGPLVPGKHRRRDQQRETKTND